MRIAVLGAAGRTGSLVMKLARNRGHDVVPIVRRAAALSDEDVQFADGRDARAIARAIAATNSVVLAIAPASGDRQPDLMRQAAAATVEAMKAASVRRLVMVGADGPWRDSGDPIIRFVLKPILGIAMRASMADQRAAEDTVRRSEVQWTVIRPARLTDGEGASYRRRRNRSNWFGFQTTRLATATAVVDALEDSDSIGAAFSVAS